MRGRSSPHSLHPPHPHSSFVLESDAAKELSGLAGSFDNELAALHLGREHCNLVDHEASDPFPPQLRGNHNIVDKDRRGCDLDRNDRGEIADQLAYEAHGRHWRCGGMEGQKLTDSVVIGGVDRTDVETLATHANAIVTCSCSINSEANNFLTL